MMRWAEKPVKVEERVRIEPDGTIVALSGKIEYGQGIRTAFSKIVAEELAVPIERVRIVLGETDQVPWDMGTFGSMSVATDGHAIRRAAAFTRERLLDRAAARFGADRDALTLADGRVRGPDGKSASYAELAGEAPIAGDAPETTPRVPPPVERAPLRLEARAIVTGQGRYAADVRLPGMLRGHALSPPVYGSRLVKLDDSAAREMPGVVAVVHEGDFAGVVAERDEQALAAVRALVAEWEPPADPPPEKHIELRADEEAQAAFESGKEQLSARYVAPHIAHASIGTSAAVVDVREDGTDVYVATQRPFPLRDEIAEICGVEPGRVHIHPQLASGTYGRNAGSDAAVEATRLSRAVGRPVLVQWTRAEELRRSPYRPEVTGEVAAVLDDGRIAAWRYTEHTNPHTYGGGELPPQVVIMTSGRNAVPQYNMPVDAHLYIENARVRTGAFRSLAAAPNTFAIESFMDEIARHVGADPFELRLAHLDDARLVGVLEAVRKQSGWTERTREAGRGFGVACTLYHGTYVAEVVEVGVTESGKVKLERVWCAVDPGRIVHPDGAVNQAEGAIQQAASWTLMEELRHREGRVTAASFGDYPIARFSDIPASIDVTLVGDGNARSTGMGEPPSVPVAAAIANAVFDACGARVRTLPITQSAVREALLKG